MFVSQERGYAMDTYKLRIKVGPHEFEAEGPKDSVTAQFEAWKELIASLPATPKANDQTVSKTLRVATEVRTRDGSLALPWDIFDADEKRKLVTLRVHPIGEQKYADAALLIVYGYRQSSEQDEVLVTKLKESMEVSGLRPARIDRIIAPHIKAGLLMKTGLGKGGKYRLTNTGFAKADEMARALFEKLI